MKGSAIIALPGRRGRRRAEARSAAGSRGPVWHLGAILAKMKTEQAKQAVDDRPKDLWSAVEAIPQSRTYEAVVAQIHQLIRNGHLKPGDKLPPEREMVEHFKVGRSSIRDALRVLEVMGTVKVRQGGGTVIQDLSPQTLVTPLATMLTRRRAMVAELMDLRRILEPPLAARAAKNATAEDIAHLEGILARQQEKLSRGEPSGSEDAEFHNGVARACGNRVVLNVLDILMDLLSETRAQTLLSKARAQRSLAGHRRILRAIARRDPTSAEISMRHHIRSVGTIVLDRL